MANGRRKGSGYQNSFHYGILSALVVVVIIGVILSSFGLISFGNQYSSEAYANSLSPRKGGPNWYTPPTVNPNRTDFIAPTVNSVNPVSGSPVDPGTKSGSYYIVPVELTASDNDRIGHVAIYVNNVLDSLLYYNATTYQAAVRVPNQAGSYEIKAIAYDYDGNPGEARSTVIVPARGK